LTYNRNFGVSSGIVLALHIIIALLAPKFEVDAAPQRKAQAVIQIDDIPETQQIQRPPPPPRPAVPIATESEEVPDDVTIESTDLDFDQAMIEVPPPPPTLGTDAPEEEIVEFWAVEQAPEIVREVVPVYPEVARKAGIEGTVFLQFVVGKNGQVRDIEVLKGPEILRESAVKAVSEFVFKPAVQNDRPVTVRMTRAIRFRLAGG
jgi:protein TonB